MSRVRARSLVLVNWKGVFYEHYALDESVTALEGDNGAGKTTVMIAAYMTLLPDMTRLRFTNVGESDATGGDRGVWGRLGNPNRPSYAALAFDLAGERVVAGVHIERKGEPSVELMPFLITDLPDEIRLHEALLLSADGQDLVPEIEELRGNVTRLGGRIQVFRTAKDYFAALFDRGITPLRLVADAERTRFNDMLRTSMTGGISRALTSEFRNFLLREETGLADTLVRMRGNLEACRRTRIEVREARQLEGEISDVYEAGHEMFAASLLAARERAAELRRRVDEATRRRDAAKRERDDIAREHAETVEARADADRRLAGARAQHEEAAKLLARVEAAYTSATRVAELDAELDQIGRALDEARAALDRAEREKRRRADERTRAEDAYRRAAEGLANLQSGLEELHRRADAHRAVQRRLAEARDALGAPDLDADNVAAREQDVRDNITALDEQRHEIHAALGGADAHRAAHAEAMHSLALILGREPDPATAAADAADALRRLTELELRAERASTIEEDLRRARAAHERQRVARSAAAALARLDQPLASSLDVASAVRGTDAELREAEEDARTHAAKAEERRRLQQTLRNREAELRARLARWRELDAVAAGLEAALGRELRSAQALDAARRVLDHERDETKRGLEELEKARDEARGRARALELNGGDFHPNLLTLRDLVGGELLASHFDDLEPTEAAQVQARLGPLADAIVVDDAREAAASLDGHERELDTVWFVEAGSLRDVAEPDGAQLGAGADVTVEQDGIVRRTRVPERPTLGRKARQRLISELRSRAEDLSARISEHEARLAEVEAARRNTALLTRELATLAAGDPAPELEAVATELDNTAAAIEEHDAAAADARARATRIARRGDALRELLADAFLLDEPDLAAKLAELEAALQAARRARAELERVAAARQALADRLDVLRRPPLPEEQLDQLRRRLEELNERRRRLFHAQDALRYVVENRAALEWTDAEAALDARRELVPALKAQCDRAEAERNAAVAAFDEAEQAWDRARESWRKIDHQRGALAASRERAAQELKETGVTDASAAAVAQAREAVQRLDEQVAELDRAERELGETVARLAERLEGRERALAEAEEFLAREEREWRPAEEQWERLRARAEAGGLITPAIRERLLETGIGSPVLRTDARRWNAVLKERLKGARGGAELLERLDTRLTASDQTMGEEDLETWELVRDWLRRRVPAQIAEVADPLEALQRLRHHLAALDKRLEQQEAELRGTSGDVARGIDVHIRSAHRQVKKLNHELEGVRFGTIRGIRIRLARDGRMEGILNALREGTAQELLFAPELPIEEALDQLFSRYGGRGPTGAQKLLDYREYLDVAVEVRRQAGPDWERVNPSRLSTGEAIGVGTALMMVVLTAWEHAANLFRQRRSLGTLRLLFLDEANRLSKDNLEVLFELCSALELQLLIAAPEVAHARGGTTYRLVRRETADGGEEVVVSGRRTIATDTAGDAAVDASGGRDVGA